MRAGRRYGRPVGAAHKTSHSYRCSSHFGRVSARVALFIQVLFVVLLVVVVVVAAAES